MKTTPKRLLGLLLAVLLIVSQPLTALAATTDTVSQSTAVNSGVTGGVSWELDTDGVLTLSVAENGNGETETNFSTGKQPWCTQTTKVKKLIVEEGVTRLGYNLIRGCTTLEEVELPASLEFIDGNAFRGCTSLKKVTFNQDCKIITPSDAKKPFSFALFEGCTALEEIVLPAGDYTQLREIAFGGCTALKRITIPANVTSMLNRDTNNDSPFLSCAALEQINYGGTVAQWEAIVADNLKHDGSLANSSITVICSDGTYQYKSEGSGEEEIEAVSGQTGNVSWTLDSNGKLTLSAVEGTDGKTGDFTKDNYKDAALNELYGHKDQIKTIEVQEGVTYLGAYLLRGVGATSVSFPSTLTTIGNSCFRDSGLESVTIPANVTEIDNWAFMGSAALKTAVVNASITQLKERVFGNCTALTTVTLPATIASFEVTSKGQNAFSACAALTTVNFGGTVEAWHELMENNAITTLQKSSIFVACSDGNYVYGSGRVNYTIGTSGTTNWKLDLDTDVLTITAQPGTDGVGADYTDYKSTPFYPYKDQIKSVVVEEGVTVLGYRMLREIGMETLSLPEGLLEIKSDCLRECPNLKEVTLPSSLQVLARTSFFKCTALTKVVLNGSFTVIEDKTFSGCKLLKEIIWNAPVASINNQGFNACAGIREITYNGTISQWIKLINTKGIMGGEPGKESDAPADGASTLRKEYITVHCTNGDYVYGRNYIENDLFYALNEGTLVIDGNGAIADYEVGKAPWSSSASTITTVILMSGITSVGENAFADCTSITAVRYAGTSEQWEALKSASKSGNESLFSKGYSYAYVGSIGSNVTWSFEPETGKLTLSGTGATYDYTSRKGLPYFHLLSEVKSVVVEEGVTTVGNYIFQYMTNLTSVTLPESLRIVGTFTFGYCEKLTEVNIPEGVIYIGSKTFSSCKLTKLTLPSTLKYIDMKCFDGASVADLYYNGTVDAWELIEISSQAQGNANLLSASIHYLPDLTISDIVSDVTADDWYADDILFLYNKGLLCIENKSFSPAETSNLSWLLDALYIRAGQSGQYEGAAAWALSNGIIEKDAANTISLSQLALILYRTAVYNGQAPAGGDIAAMGWLETQSYAEKLYKQLPELKETDTLTRGELASVLAAYMGSKEGTADRDDVILAELKAIIEKGGDNKLHIVSLDAPSGASKAGDSTLIIFPNGEVMLLDALTAAEDNEARILSILDRAGITSIDYLVNSHAHSDHIGNFAAVIDHIYANGGEVKHYYAAYGSNYSPSVQTNLETKLKNKGIDTNTGLREGDVLTIGGVTINIYAPSQAFLDETTGTTDEPVNNTSMVMKLTYGKSTYLTCGDIYRARERYLVATYGDAIKADVIKLNHHGCYTSNSMDWIHATDAKIMFAPSDDVGDSILMSAVSAEGRAYYSNGCDGLIHISMDAEANYEVETRFDSNNRSTFDYCSANGHEYGEWFETKAPSCTEAGTERRDCKNCDHYEERKIEAKGHDYGEWYETKAPTCTEAGTERRDCKNCDHYEEREIEAKGHDYGEWYETKAPTCTEKGEERRDCKHCDHYETRETDAKGHTEVIDKAVDATCTETGLTEGKHCSECGEILVKQEIVEALGHETNGWQHDENGHWQECDRCHERLNEGEHDFHNGNCAVCGKTMTGWALENDTWSYYIDGAAQTGWLYLNGVWYYLDETGVMQTGWVNVGGTWYYMNASGAMQTGWIYVNDVYYYLYENGAMATGWIYVNDVYYYLYDNGAMATGWIYVNDVYYYLYDNGAMATGWIYVNGVYYYLHGNGAMAIGWIYVNDVWYYLDASGAMVCDCTLDIGGVNYTFNASGAWVA